MIFKQYVKWGMDALLRESNTIFRSDINWQRYGYRELATHPFFPFNEKCCPKLGLLAKYQLLRYLANRFWHQ